METKTILLFDRDGKDISDEVDLKDGRALPGGWSQYQLWHRGIQIGWIENGVVDLKTPGYTHKIV